MTNRERAERIKKALSLGEQQDKSNKYYRVADVLSDLRHYCDKNNLDWVNEVNQADLFYDEEKRWYKNEEKEDE